MSTATTILTPNQRRPITMTSPLAIRLQGEWDRLSRRPAAVRRMNGWSVVPLTLSSLDELLALTGYVRSTSRRPGDPPPPTGADADQANQLLGQLLGVAATDPLAARVVLQRLLPGLANAAHRRGDQPDQFEDLVAAAWSVIRQHNPARRPRYFAATLLRDCEYLAFRRHERRLLSVTPTSPYHFDEEPSAEGVQEPIDELSELMANAHRAGVIDEQDLALLRGSLAGQPARDLAAELRIKPRMLRYRRGAVTARLRLFALAAA